MGGTIFQNKYQSHNKNINWATTQENVYPGVFTQGRLKLAHATVQSDLIG